MMVNFVKLAAERRMQREGRGERPTTGRPAAFPAGESDAAPLLQGEIGASYSFKAGRPNYSSEEIGLSVSVPVLGAGPEGLEARIAEAHAAAVRAMELRVHDLFAEIEARRAAEARR